METKNNKHYFAFISYKRQDEEWAKWFQKELEDYHLPSTLNGRDDIPEAFRPVFRDIDELKAGNLPTQIYNALASSSNLVVICSTQLADDENAKWVNKEISDFIEIGKNEGRDNVKYIFPFIVDGVPHAGNERECFPRMLRELAKEQERIGGNINEGGDVSEVKRERAFVKVLAGMLPDNVSFDMLWNRYDRDKMERERKEKEERDKLLIAQSRFVAEKALKLIDDGDTDLAIKLELEVLPKDLYNPDRPYCVEAEAALRKTVWADKNNYRVFKGHEDQVVFSRFAPNDDIIVSLSHDETLRIWNVNDGRELFSKNLIGDIRSFEFNDKGDSVVLISPNGVLHFIDIETGQEAILSDKKAYANFRYKFDKVLLKRLGKALVYKDGCFYLLDLETKELKLIIDDCPKPKRFSISYDECVIQCLCSNNTYISWNLHGVKLLDYSVSDPVRIVLYSPNRKHLLLSSNRVVDCTTGKEVVVFEKMANTSIRKAAFSEDGRFLALSTYEKSLVWDSKFNSYIFLDDALGVINDFSFSNNGEMLLASAADGTIKMIAINTRLHSLFHGEKGRGEISMYRHLNDINRIHFFSDKKRLAFSSLDSIVVLDIANEKCIGHYPNSGDAGHRISFDKSEKVLVTTWKKEGPVESWMVLAINIETGKAEHYYQCRELWSVIKQNIETRKVECNNVVTGNVMRKTRYYHPSFSPDDRFVASICDAYEKTPRYRVVLWNKDTTEEQCLFKHDASEGEIFNYSFSNDGSLLVTCTRESIVLWDVEQKKSVLTKKDSVLKDTSLLFYFDRRISCGLVVYSTDNHRVKIWDIDNDKTIELKGHTENVMNMALDLSGKILATVSADKNIKTWDVQTGERLNTLSGHSACINSVNFNYDGSLLASASDDGTIRVWDVKTGTNIEIIKAHYGAVGTVCFSPDGTMLASGGIYDFAVRVWDYPSLQELIDNYRERYKNSPLTLNEKTKYYLE